MKKWLVASALMMLATGALAAGKPCDELKSEIKAKLDANGVTDYKLEVVDKGTPAGNVVGSCEGGTKDIVYRRD